MPNKKHEFNDIFTTINLQMMSLKQIFPELIDGYRIAKAENLLDSGLTNRQLNSLFTIATNLEAELDRLNRLVSD